jgi:hypothetical protein
LPAVRIHTVLQINNGNFSFVFMFLGTALSKILEIWTTNVSNALIIAVVSAILHTLPDILFISKVCLKSTEKQLKQQISRNIVIIRSRAIFFTSLILHYSVTYFRFLLTIRFLW